MLKSSLFLTFLLINSCDTGQISVEEIIGEYQLHTSNGDAVLALKDDFSYDYRVTIHSSDTYEAHGAWRPVGENPVLGITIHDFPKTNICGDFVGNDTLQILHQDIDKGFTQSFFGRLNIGFCAEGEDMKKIK